MADIPTDVFVGGYSDIDAATKDFDALAGLVGDRKIEIEAAILITHAEDGTVTVEQTADHRAVRIHRGESGSLGRRSAPWVVGCFGLNTST
jgi:uncharacterized membrane protein